MRLWAAFFGDALAGAVALLAAAFLVVPGADRAQVLVGVVAVVADVVDVGRAAGAAHAVVGDHALVAVAGEDARADLALPVRRELGSAVRALPLAGHLLVLPARGRRRAAV